MTIGELQQEFLTSEDPRIAPEDFFILLAHSLGQDKTFVIAHPEYILDTPSASLARTLLERRVANEPIALITGRKAFYGRDFFVTQDTLIPRPETELLVELALNAISHRKKKSENIIHIVDIGTGSGNIIISIVADLIQSHSKLSDVNSAFLFSAVDISKSAITVAKKNAEQHNVSNKITFHTGDLLQPVKKTLPTTNRVIIIANLPYLSRALYANTSKDVRLFEPQNALVSGETGLDHYVRLLQEITHFSPRINTFTLFLEISPEQNAPLHAIASHLLPDALLRTHHDLANKARVLEIHRNPHDTIKPIQ